MLSSVLLAGCASDALQQQGVEQGKIVCDSYIVLDMCVRDLENNGVVDMVYFSDSREIFMYRAGWKEKVGKIMPFHQCAVVLSAQMQETTNRILLREDLSLGEELAITRDLITSYMAAKPEIDACNASFEDAGEQPLELSEEFFMEEEAWESE